MSGQRQITTTKASIVSSVLAGSLILIGCSDKAGDSSDSSATTTAGPTSDSESTGGETTTTTDETTTTTDGTTDSTTTEDGSETDTTTDTTMSDTEETTTAGDSDPFIPNPDVPLIDFCDTYVEDCDTGEKCMPWVDDGGSSWNALKCVDIMGEGQAGDPCIVEGDGHSGIDDCALHHMCWDVDSETNKGTCISFCNGNTENPSCESTDDVCVIANDGILNLCLPKCDPLLQDCPGDDAGCFPVNNAFACAPASSEDMGFENDQCSYTNSCKPGLMCADGTNVPGCTNSFCCTPMCDLDGMNMCADGKECIPIYPEQPMVRVGLCGVMP